ARSRAREHTRGPERPGLRRLSRGTPRHAEARHAGRDHDRVTPAAGRREVALEGAQREIGAVEVGADDLVPAVARAEVVGPADARIRDRGMERTEPGADRSEGGVDGGALTDVGRDDARLALGFAGHGLERGPRAA